MPILHPVLLTATTQVSPHALCFSPLRCHPGCCHLLGSHSDIPSTDLPQFMLSPPPSATVMFMGTQSWLLHLPSKVPPALCCSRDGTRINLLNLLHPHHAPLSRASWSLLHPFFMLWSYQPSPITGALCWHSCCLGYSSFLLLIY